MLAARKKSLQADASLVATYRCERKGGENVFDAALYHDT